MAQKITIALEDDLDGGPADETVRFELGGAEYEIDLSKKNARAFRKQLAPFIEHARKAGRDSAAGPGVPQHAGSAAAISGRGRKARASRSATAGASPRVSLSSTKPPPKDPDTSGHTQGPNRPAQMTSGPSPPAAACSTPRRGRGRREAARGSADERAPARAVGGHSSAEAQAVLEGTSICADMVLRGPLYGRLCMWGRVEESA